MDFFLAEFRPLHEQIKGNRYVYLATNHNVASGHARFLTISLEPASNSDDARAFRDVAKKRLLKSGSEDPKFFEHSSIPVLRYSKRVSNEFAGIYSEFSNVRSIAAYFAHNDSWISLTVDFTKIDKQDERDFYSLVDSIQFVDTSKPVSSFDYYHKGRPLYLQGNFESALQPFATALALERQKPSLEDDLLRQLVTELADTYGALRKPAEHKQVLDYGVERFPSYATFYWAIARYYAAFGKLDETLIALEQAFAYEPRANPSQEFHNVKTYLVSETPPDPISNPAFATFKSNERFRKAVKEMQKKWMQRK